MTAFILLTGATGLIGFRVLQTLLSAGHTVRCAVRSEAKMEIISSNPIIEKLSPGNRLSFTIVPDICVDGAYDAALKDITHVLHVGSPVPIPGREPEKDVYHPIVQGIQGLLVSALRTPTIKQVIITSSIVANLSPTPSTNPPGSITAASRVQLDPSTPAFTSVFEAYHIGKIHSLNAADAFAVMHSPHFAITHIIPGYVFGRNELATEPSMLLTSSSSNNLLMAMLTGAVLPVPLLGGAAHIDDVAEVHLRALLLAPTTAAALPRDFGVSVPIVYNDAFDFVAKRFPNAVAEGVFKRGNIPTMPVPWDASETERVLGITFRSFESAVLDLAGQYLDLLGKARA